ncbi:MAG: hypothetical protein E6G32_02235 [Actinobacteria bacterium]|nr:MAG: hypothetical protein E6G32_02235 [Actinomycetota bacterium]
MRSHAERDRPRARVARARHRHGLTDGLGRCEHERPRDGLARVRRYRRATRANCRRRPSRLLARPDQGAHGALRGRCLRRPHPSGDEPSRRQCAPHRRSDATGFARPGPAPLDRSLRRAGHRPSPSLRPGGTGPEDARGRIRCALGSVVERDARVRGVENLYVADASIMPTVPRANTHLTVLGIAEKIAEQLR